MKCADCKYWDRDKDEAKWAGSLRVQACHKAPQWWVATEWTNKTDPECEWDNYRRVRPEYEGTKMFVQDGSDYLATLYTAADFGCVHFDKIETNTQA